MNNVLHIYLFLFLSLVIGFYLSLALISINLRGIDSDQVDPMVIIIELANYAMKTLVNIGSLVDILYLKTFKKI